MDQGVIPTNKKKKRCVVVPKVISGILTKPLVLLFRKPTIKYAKINTEQIANGLGKLIATVRHVAVKMAIHGMSQAIIALLKAHWINPAKIAMDQAVILIRRMGKQYAVVPMATNGTPVKQHAYLLTINTYYKLCFVIIAVSNLG